MCLGNHRQSVGTRFVGSGGIGLRFENLAPECISWMTLNRLICSFIYSFIHLFIQC
jgi:hypothetical protein